LPVQLSRIAHILSTPGDFFKKFQGSNFMAMEKKQLVSLSQNQNTELLIDIVETLDNNALKNLLKTSILSKWAEKDKQSLIQYADEKNTLRFGNFILEKIGEKGKSQLEAELIGTYGQDYDFNSLLAEIKSYRPDTSITRYLNQPPTALTGKSLCLDFRETEIASVSCGELPFNYKSGQIEKYVKYKDCICFYLEDHMQITVYLTGPKSDKSDKIVICRKENMNFHKFLQSLFQLKMDKKNKTFNIASPVTKNRLELQEGKYILCRTIERRQMKEGFFKSLLTKKEDTIFEQFFEITNDEINQTHTLRVYDTGSPEKIIKAQIGETVYELHEINECQVICWNEFEVKLKDNTDIDKLFKISAVQNNEQNIKIKKKEKLDKLEKKLINLLQQPDNEMHFNQLLDDLLRNNFGLISKALLDIQLNNMENKGVVRLGNRLTKMAQLCRDVKLYTEHDANLEQFLLVNIVSKANFAKLTTAKGKNLSILKIVELMKLLTDAFDYIKKMEKKQLILFFGDTGSGKSTTVNYFSGINLKETKNNFGIKTIEVADDCKHFPHAKIGQSIVTSETKFMQAFPIIMQILRGDTRASGYMDLSQIMLVDCPGFGDTRGELYNICTKISVDKTFNNAGLIKGIVLVVPNEAFSSSFRSGPLNRLFNELETIIPSITNTANNLANFVFLVVTKHPDPENALDAFEQGLSECEREISKQINDIKDPANAEERVPLIKKHEIWQFLLHLSKTGNIHFVNTAAKSLRTKFLKRILSQDGIAPKYFNPTVKLRDQLEFAQNIQKSVNLWRNSILSPFLRENSQKIGALRDIIADCLKKIGSLQEDIKHDSDRIPELTAEIQSKEKLKIKFLAFRKQNNHAEALKLIEENNVAFDKSKISALKQEKVILQTKMDDKQKILQKKQTDKAVKLKHYDQLIVDCKQEIKEKTAEMQRLSDSEETVVLKHLHYKEDEMLYLRTWKDGARESVHTQVRPSEDSDFVQDENGNVKYDKVKASEYEGELYDQILLSEDFCLVPKDMDQRKNFENYRKKIKEPREEVNEQREVVIYKSQAEPYTATVEGSKFRLDLFPKTAPTGKSISYAFITTWKKGESFPWIKITHTIPRIEFNAAAIAALDAEIENKKKSIIEYTTEIKDIETNKNNLANLSIESLKREHAEIETAMKNIDSSIVAIQITNVENSSFIPMLDHDIREKGEQINQIQQSIAARNREIQGYKSNIRQYEDKISSMSVHQKHLTIVIKQQLQTLELLRTLSSSTILFGENKLEPTNFSADCVQFNAFYDQNKKNIIKMCETEIKSHNLFQQGLDCLGNNESEKALKYFDEEININPYSLIAQQGLAITLFYQGCFKEGALLLKQVDDLLQYKSHEQQVSLWMARGQLYLAIGRNMSAKSCFQQVIVLEPNHLDAKNRVAAIELQESVHSWYFDDEIKLEESSKQADYKMPPYKLIPASPKDIYKVITLYYHRPVPGMEIANVEIVYNPGFNRGFSLRMRQLQERERNNAFKPSWNQEKDADGGHWRKKIHMLSQEMASFYKDSDYPNVKILPLWHGTDPAVLDSIFKAGYANLAKTDPGFFGKGLYGTTEAEYAYRIYGKGNILLLNWVSYFSAYPTIDEDMNKLIGKGNYQNYDATFAPVVPHNPKNPNEMNYFPTKPGQLHQYVEVVVFESTQCLPRYKVTLQASSIPRSPRTLFLVNNRHTFFKTFVMKATNKFNLIEAAQYVYENYLSKPYSLTTHVTDWVFSYGNVIVQRPNHGLAHSLRKVFYLPYVVQAFLDWPKNSYIKHELYGKIKDNIQIIQLASLFLVAGRENEMSSRDDQLVYNRFRQTSAIAFKKYVKDRNLVFDADIFKACYEGIQESNFNKGPIHAILKICHDIDAMRCLDSNSYKAVCTEIVSYIGIDACKDLMQLVYTCLVKTGDRVLAAIDVQPYDGVRFIQASQDVSKCENFIHLAIEEWESNKLNNFASVS
jgi:energy-coupling factor transporter ATP-binding protein EcfA2